MPGINSFVSLFSQMRICDNSAIKQLSWSQRRVANSALQFLIHSDEVQKKPNKNFTLNIDRVVEKLKLGSDKWKVAKRPFGISYKSRGICKGIANRVMGRVSSKKLLNTLHTCQRYMDKGVSELPVLNKEIFSLEDRINEYQEGVSAMKNHSLPIAKHFFHFLRSIKPLNYQASVSRIQTEIKRVQTENFVAESLESKMDYDQALAPHMKLLHDLEKCNPKRFPLEMAVNLRMYNQTIERYHKTIHDINQDGIPVLETNLRTILFRKLLLEKISQFPNVSADNKELSLSLILVKV